MLNILKGNPLPVYGDGKQIRDWLYVDDHNRGIELVIKNGIHGETYNIGGDNEWTNIDVINLLCDIVDTRFAEDTNLADRYLNSPCASKRSAKTLVTFVEDRPGHDRRYAVNASKISECLGYAPQENFVNGLHKTVDWYLDNEAWLAAILDGSYRV